MNSFRRVLVAVAVAGLVLAGCGGNGGAAPSSTVPASAPAGAGAVDAGLVAAVAAAQARAGSSHITMKAALAGQQLTVVGDIVGGATAAEAKLAMTIDSPGLGNAEVRLLGGTLYANAGPLTKNKFLKVDLLDKTNPLVAQFGSLATQLDPARQMADFADALVSIKRAGTAVKLDGVLAQPYAIVIDPAKLPAGAAGPTGLPAGNVGYTMFVGPDKLPRRIIADVDGDRVTVNYSRWGQPVGVKAPPAGETITAADLNLPGAVSG